MTRADIDTKSGKDAAANKQMEREEIKEI